LLTTQVSVKRIRLLQTLCHQPRFLLPINVLEDFTKPLSLSFRLFGNILADELVVGVLVALVPLVIPINYAFRFIYKWNSSISFATLAGAYIGESLEDHH
jgi:F-type H+-transporting ATPase subunit a